MSLVKRWLRRHRIIAALVGIGAVLLNWLPQWVASVWSLYSNEPIFQWLGEHHLLRLTFSPLYITGPISFILLGFILWGLFSPARRSGEEPDSRFVFKSGSREDQHPLAVAMDDLRALYYEGIALLGPYYVADTPKPNMDDVNKFNIKIRNCARRRAWGDLIRLHDLKRLEDREPDENFLKTKAKYHDAGLLSNLTSVEILIFDSVLNRVERLAELIARIEEREQSTPEGEPKRQRTDLPSTFDTNSVRVTLDKGVAGSVEKFAKEQAKQEERLAARQKVLYDAAAFAQNVSVEAIFSFNAICAAQAHTLRFNEDLVWVCDELVKNKYKHPFEGLEDYIPQADWLEFVQRATLRSDIRTRKSGDYLKLAEEWPKIKGYPNPTKPIPLALVLLNDVLEQQGAYD